MTRTEAKAAGYIPLTIEYRIPSEQKLLDSVLADFTKANKTWLLIDSPNGVEVWHKCGSSDYKKRMERLSPTTLLKKGAGQHETNN